MAASSNIKIIHYCNPVPKSVIDKCLQLVEINMKALYIEAKDVGWNLQDKTEEMQEGEMEYFVARLPGSDAIIGFVSFQQTEDDCYLHGDNDDCSSEDKECTTVPCIYMSFQLILDMKLRCRRACKGRVLAVNLWTKCTHSERKRG
jgi:hypothetical protein